MDIDWSFTAQTYLDQLSASDRGIAEAAVAGLRSGPENATPCDVTLVTPLSRSEPDLYSLRAGHDLFVLFHKEQKDKILVVDVVRRAQIEGMKKLDRAAS